VQAKVFRASHLREEAPQQVRVLLDALKLGAPSHGGIALGMERIRDVAERRRRGLRDVIFPVRRRRGKRHGFMPDAPNAVFVSSGGAEDSAWSKPPA